MDWWIIFPMPDASSELFNWDASILYEFWSYLMIGFFVLVFINNIWFYFFTLPDSQALKKYWLRYLFCGLLLIGLAIIFILTNTEKLIEGPQPFNIWRLLWLILILAIDYLEMTFIIGSFFLGFSLIPSIKLQIRAMRRYPFYFRKH